ncbi:uncharacterized protein Fot_57461 [Forsythia ovata]|uniref:Uncharacterized protein n=1 Tax=Forsythia ovata TaxID=205694 RepID=A0ABD1NX68_9LAMI
MRATGPNAPRFANEIGVEVRQYAPLKKIWWKDVTDAEKSPMYSRKARKHDEVLNQDYWDFLCDYWESEAFKKKSKRNATNRSKLTHGHCSGSRSFLNTQAMGHFI